MLPRRLSADSPRTKSRDIAESLDDGLGSLVRSQVLATQRVVDVPRVDEGFAVIVKRLRDALPGAARRSR